MSNRKIALDFEWYLLACSNDKTRHKWKIDYIISQYTWLKDKNWKEIYEGDIVRKQVDIKYTNIWPWVCKKEPIYRNYLYKWEGMWFVSKSLSPEPKYYESWGDHNNKEIIGNIYENLELLSST